ncbi:hypothetical protein ACLMJK_005649 [Lecanora helva]
MHFSTSTILLSLFAIGHVVSLPAPDADLALIERDDPDDCGGADTPDKVKRAQCKQPVQCGPSNDQVAYPSNYVNSAVKQAKNYRSKGTTNGGIYPEVYGANDNAIINALPPECKPGAGLKLYEYPIVEGGLFNGDNSKAGPDRVLISEKDGVRSYCLTMTHRGATDNSFVVCPGTTA